MAKRKKVKTIIYAKKTGVGFKKATKKNVAAIKKKGVKYETF